MLGTLTHSLGGLFLWSSMELHLKILNVLNFHSFLLSHLSTVDPPSEVRPFRRFSGNMTILHRCTLKSSCWLNTSLYLSKWLQVSAI